MKSIDISGFGGGYEAVCQLMLLRGRAWLKEHPDFDFGVYKQCKMVFGLCAATTDQSRELDNVLCAGVDVTGAMHHALIFHLAYIHKHGYDEWLARAERNGRQVIEVDESKLEHDCLIARREWQLKLDRGDRPLAELFKALPPENSIVIDLNDPITALIRLERLVDLIQGDRGR